MKFRWIIVLAVVILAAVVIFGSRPFTTTTDSEPGQPSPHAITQ
jgi:hypothetical protein